MIPSARLAVLSTTVLLALAAACGAAQAQQRPLTGQMLGETAPAPARIEPNAALPARDPVAPVTAVQDSPRAAPYVLPPAYETPRPASAKPQIGDTTRALLQLQASGTQAGPRLPILGDQASASYARYLESFTHPIPEYLQHSVRKDVSGSGSGSGD